MNEFLNLKRGFSTAKSSKILEIHSGEYNQKKGPPETLQS